MVSIFNNKEEITTTTNIFVTAAQQYRNRAAL
jgi:hypothetical protein